jgi:hypothetical protein
VHWACGTNVQDPSAKQHAPEGCGHGFGVQVVPAPSHEPPAPAHAVAVINEQVPFVKQHAPWGSGATGQKVSPATPKPIEL